MRILRVSEGNSLAVLSCLKIFYIVVKNVPDDCIVVGIPTYILKRNGLTVKKKIVNDNFVIIINPSNLKKKLKCLIVDLNSIGGYAPK